MFFYMHHPSDRIEHTTASVISVVEHWLKREIVQLVQHEGSIRRPVAPERVVHEVAATCFLSRALSCFLLTVNKMFRLYSLIKKHFLCSCSGV